MRCLSSSDQIRQCEIIVKRKNGERIFLAGFYIKLNAITRRGQPNLLKPLGRGDKYFQCSKPGWISMDTQRVRILNNQDSPMFQP